jgi:hypothetical protein
MPINFIPNIKSSEEVYDIGCLCEVKIREQKEFGVKIFYFDYFLLK